MVSNLINQQIKMLETENVKLNFSDDAKQKIADIAVKCNDNVENIGARRLAGVGKITDTDNYGTTVRTSVFLASSAPIMYSTVLYSIQYL